MLNGLVHADDMRSLQLLWENTEERGGGGGRYGNATRIRVMRGTLHYASQFFEYEQGIHGSGSPHEGRGGGGGDVSEPSTSGFGLLSLEARKTIASWKVSEVSNLLRKCNLMQQADAVDKNSVDCRLLLILTRNELQCAIEEGGLGLKPLQIRRICNELETMTVQVNADLLCCDLRSTCSVPTTCACQICTFPVLIH